MPNPLFSTYTHGENRVTATLVAVFEQVNTRLSEDLLEAALELPKVTLYGVWKGKSGQDWHNERLKLDCRSPKVESVIERDRKILSEADGQPS